MITENKKCIVCGGDISHKTSNAATKCEKCSRIPTVRMRDKIKKRSKGIRPLINDVLRNYNYSCAICKWSMAYDINMTKFSKQAGCEIHHIESIAEGGKDIIENLILLCPNHHKEADYGLINKETLNKYLVKEVDVQDITRERLIESMKYLYRK